MEKKIEDELLDSIIALQLATAEEEAKEAIDSIPLLPEESKMKILQGWKDM